MLQPMELPVISCFIFSLITVTTGTFSHSFEYDRQDLWPDLCVEGGLQSPIPLYEGSAIKRDYTPMIFEGLDQEAVAIVFNDGHTVKVRLNNAVPPKVKGGGLPEHYTLDSFHFHWNSEHTIEDKRFPLESHFVFYATPHGNLQNATRYKDGIAVFAVLYALSPDEDDEIKPLMKALESLHGEMGVQKAINNFKIKDYLPRDTAGFYRYNGSLTTPYCWEVVVWTVFTNTIPISKVQVAKFDAMKNGANHLLTHNFRKLQPINGRTIYLKQSPVPDKSNIQLTSPLLLVLTSFIVHTLNII